MTTNTVLNNSSSIYYKEAVLSQKYNMTSHPQSSTHIFRVPPKRRFSSSRRAARRIGSPCAIAWKADELQRAPFDASSTGSSGRIRFGIRRSASTTRTYAVTTWAASAVNSPIRICTRTPLACLTRPTTPIHGIFHIRTLHFRLIPDAVSAACLTRAEEERERNPWRERCWRFLQEI